MKSDVSGKWFLIEQLAPQREPTVVWNGHRRADWTSLKRLASKENMPWLPKAVDAAMAIPLKPFDERESAPLAELPVPDGRRAVVWHVPESGPVQKVPWGVLVWVGPAEGAPESRPRAAGVSWDPTNGNIHNSPDTFLLSASNLDHYADITDPDSFFARTVHFPELAKLVEVAFSEPTGLTLATSCTLLHDDGHLVNNFFVAKQVLFEGGGHEVRGITMDISMFEPPTIDPDTAARIVQTTPDGHSRGILALREADNLSAPEPVISYWSRPGAPPWLPHWSEWGPVARGQNGIIHPEDHRAVADAAGALGDVGASTLVIRVAALAGQWRTVETTLARYTGSSRLFILQLPN